MANNTGTETRFSLSALPLKAKDFKTDAHADWCPGCGDFGIVNVLQQVYADMQLDPAKVVTVSGVGCSSKTPHFVKTYGVHTLHGRSLPFAYGIKMANPELTVVVTGGDGDGYGIGAGHFLHAGRRNVDMTYIVYDNQVYGLTKGQASPTLGLGEQPKSLPVPNTSEGVNPLALAISAGYTFVARSYAFHNKHLKETLKRAIMHRGMSIVDVLQPCPTYNNLHDKDWFAEMVEVNGQQMPRVYDLAETDYNGRVDSLEELEEKSIKAIARVSAKEERIPLGVFFEVDKPTLLDRIVHQVPELAKPVAQMPITQGNSNKPLMDLTEIYQEFRIQWEGKANGQG